MPDEAFTFLDSERVGVFAIQMLDGAPHGATLHFAYMREPLTFIFQTSPKYKKVEALRNGNSRASLVIGTDEKVMKTLQMDGIATLTGNKNAQDTYFSKFPKKKTEWKEDIFFIFTPTWWRYTDWTKTAGKQIYSSDA